LPPHRIGFDAIRALRNSTGLGNYARGVLRGLHQVNPQLGIHLYAPDPGRAEFRDLPGQLDATLHLAAGSVSPLSRMLWRTFRLGRDAARDHVDLYHGLTHEIPRDLPATGIPSVVSFHDLIYEKSPQYFRPVDRWSYRWRYRWSATHATALIAVSEQTRDDLMEWYGIEGTRIAVIPPARDASFCAQVPLAERAAVCTKYGVPAEFLFSLGTLEPRKNHRALIAALAALGPGDAPPLVLAGRDGGALRSLQADIAARQLTNRVHVLTNVATADLPALMQSATIFLYPSLVEGFGMPIVEALSAGIPVIAASGGCLAEAGGPASRYVSPSDPSAWASTIRDLTGDAAARAQIAASGLAWATQFDGDRLAARMLAVYDAVMAGEAVVKGEP
jgi:glycosyltransferase involved in cell wall biosynthesis